MTRFLMGTAALTLLAALPAASQQANTDQPHVAEAQAAAVTQAEGFTPETVTVRERIAPGANVFVSQESLDGAGSLAVFGQDDLALKVLLPTGIQNQMLISADGKTAYAQSSFLKRITYGPMEQALSRFDVETGIMQPEVVIPPKAAMALTYSSYLRETEGGRFVLVQNGTPASSITVVDTAAGEAVQEIPTPGCWGIYPTQDTRFFTLCGDGSMASFTLSDDGKAADKTSAKVFDPDADPLFIEGARLGADWLFASYHGQLVRVTDDGSKIAQTAAFDLVDGVEGGWAPGGYGILTANAAKGMAFVGMHSAAYDGSHKNPMEEIWAVDLSDGKVTARSESGAPLASVAVSPSDMPALFATTVEGALLKYSVDEAGALTKTAEAGLAGIALSLQVVE